MTKLVRGILKREKNVLLAYLFGSSVKNGVSRSRDLDIAVMVQRELRGLEKLEFINSLSSKVQKKTGYPVDIVLLNHAPPALRQQVVKYGYLLLQKKKGLARKLIVQTITDYLDYLSILNFFHSRTVRKKA